MAGRPSRREWGLCGGFSLWFCFCLLMPNLLSGSTELNGFFLGIWLALAGLLFPAVRGLCRLAVATPLIYRPGPALPKIRLWMLYTAVILLLWMPVFACWGPVRLAADSVDILGQALEGGLNDANPIFYTLLLRWVIGPFYRLGLTEWGAYLFGFLQMGAVAGTLAYSLVWMRRHGSGLLTGPVYTALGIHSRLTAEAWAIPLQQLGYVAAHDPQAFERENALQIERVIPVSALAQAYVPYTVDPIKRSPEFSISYFGSLSAKRDLLESWARLAGSQWSGYVYAWAAEVAGYINPRYDGGSYSFAGEEYNGSFGIFSKDLVLGLTGWDGLRPELEARARFIPPALAAFALLLCGVILALRRQTQRILGLLPVYIVWLGLLFGAPSYRRVRYMLALAFLLPAALFMALAPAESGKEGVDEANAASV